jgi:hypothetical protein
MEAGEREDMATRENGRTESMIRNPCAGKHHKTKNEIGDSLGVW